jgi:hypothetical protein
MADDVHGVFVFGDDPVPGVYVSLSDASGDLEAIDVKNGVYEALFTVDGRRVRASTSARSVVLEVTTERDLDELCERLRRWAVRGGLKSDPGDPVAVANELLRHQWSSRWPKRPRWLDRRLHGDGPPRV